MVHCPSAFCRSASVLPSYTLIGLSCSVCCWSTVGLSGLRIGALGNVATVAVLAALLGVVDPALKSLLSLQMPPALQGRAWGVLAVLQGVGSVVGGSVGGVLLKSSLYMPPLFMALPFSSMYRATWRAAARARPRRPPRRGRGWL